MTSFYMIDHDSFGSRGMPWIDSVQAGWDTVSNCRNCRTSRQRAFGDMKVEMQANKARFWPDLLGSGTLDFVVSVRFVDAMREDGIRLELGGTVEILEPLRNRLSLEDAPPYFWVDGARHGAARMDFKSTGYVRARKCRGCGRMRFSHWASDRRQHRDPPPPIVFDYDRSLGLELFTAHEFRHHSSRCFYCTDRVFDCVRRNKLTNVAFVPVERGIHGDPIGYKLG